MDASATILLAEDDENDVFLLRRAFAQVGLANRVVVVHDGQEAIGYLKGEAVYSDRAEFPFPELLLLDLKLPRLDGFDVLTWLKKRRLPAKLLVFVLSSSNQQKDIARALELGADAYLVKPHNFYELVEISRGLQRRLSEPPRATSKIRASQMEERL